MLLNDFEGNQLSSLGLKTLQLNVKIFIICYFLDNELTKSNELKHNKVALERDY